MSRTSGITGKTLNNNFALGSEIHENRVIGYLNRSPCFAIYSSGLYSAISDS